MALRPKELPIALSFFAVLLSTIVFVAPDFVGIPYKGPVMATAAAMFAALGTNIASIYLASRAKTLKALEVEAQRKRDESIVADFEDIEINELKEQITEIKQLIAKIGEGELQNIAEQLRANLVTDAADDFVLELKKKIAADDKLRQVRISTKSAFSESEERLSTEVGMLRARANTNMFIGVFIALFGASILALALFTSENKFTSLSDLVLHMAPRLSVVVLVEIFAYFFLSMYRSNLAEVRYYQNEITNIELKKVGTLLSIANSSTDSVAKLLSATDRNSVLKSNQTTQELERLKIERNGMKNTLDTLTSILGKRG